MTQPPRFRTLKRVALILLAAFLAIQFIRPSLENRPATAEIQAPDEVKQILKHSCYDCHSTESKLAWFDVPAPAYWLVIRDIREARKHINFSEIGNLPLGQQRAAVYEGLFQIEQGAMPLPAYRRLHSGVALTKDQINVLKQFLLHTNLTAPSSAAETAESDAEFSKWIATGTSLATNVQPEPNGTLFEPDYKNWIPISSSDRFDNRTIRQILGNPVAIKAIANHQINPWPDGTAFAKVAWQQQVDPSGIVSPGKFYQVEFMTRDSKKYSSTLGWGWSRWRGTDLKPYGKDAHFDTECVGCHRPLHGTNYVFTAPIPTAPRPHNTGDAVSWQISVNGVRARWAEPNLDAGLEVGLPDNPLSWRIITSEIVKTTSTMSTLYGNDVAVDYARSHSDAHYPLGSVLAFVTWSQKEDERWFGARIPANPISVEFIRVANGTNNKLANSYERYAGRPLKKMESPVSKDRISYLLTRRAAILP